MSTTRSTPSAQPSDTTAGSRASGGSGSGGSGSGGSGSGGSGSTAGSGKAPTRERLVRAASELFYREGTVAVGVDRICQQAQVSKRSMYQLFATKDDLVAAALTATGESLVPRYLPPENGSLTPRQRILSVFEWLDTAAATPEYVGCPFVNTATELKDADHPGSVVARTYKQRLTDFFEREARAAGAPDPALLAQQLTIVFDGCGSRVVVTGQPLNGLALATATAMIASAL